MGLEFKDIDDWTPSTVSIVDTPYHPLAYFEVYENDEEFVKKFKETKVNNMPNIENSESNVTMSESFFEKLFGGLISKRDPTPPVNPTPSNVQNNPSDEVSNKDLLDAIQKLDGRVTAIEEGSTESTTTEGESGETGETKTESNPTGGESGEGNTEGETPAQKTVELPLNEDGTLDMENAVVAKYIPRGSSQSQSVDGDLTRGTAPDKSLNERSGRSENGMNW